MRIGNDYYAWAQEAQIGTVIDGHKYREKDGPVALRDGSVLAVGKYLLYCEVGEAGFLQHRRGRLLGGERFWKLGSNGARAAGEHAPKEDAATHGTAFSDGAEKDDEVIEQDAESCHSSAPDEEGEAETPEIAVESELQPGSSRKRKREEDCQDAEESEESEAEETGADAGGHTAQGLF